MSASAKLHGLAYQAPSILTIATGVVTMTRQLHIIAAQSDTSPIDNLDTISIGYDTLTIDAINYYPLLFLQADAGDTITLKHGTGNIDLPGDADIALADDEWIALLWNGTNWQTFSALGF